MPKKQPVYMAQAAVIAALYAAFTLAFSPVSYGQIQFRIAEVLCILPLFTPAAVPGLFAGCVLANAAGAALGQTLVVDILLGSAATLTAAMLTRHTRKITVYHIPLLSMFFPVIINAVIVGAELVYFFKTPFFLNSCWVGLGELAVCYGLGLPLFLLIRKIGPEKIFQNNA